MRVSGNQNEVKKLKNLLDSGMWWSSLCFSISSSPLLGEPVNLDAYLDHHVISGAFKMLFREMEEPLLTFDLYKNFLGAHGTKNHLISNHHFN